MRVRVTDEDGWSHEDYAHGPDALRAVIQAARLAWRGDTAIHPDITLRHRLTEVEHWITERRSRENATDDARRSWEAQADHWRAQAKQKRDRAMGEHLRVHVYGDASGQWLTPTNRHPAPCVGAASENPEWLLRCAAQMVEHDRNIAGLARAVAGEASAQMTPKWQVIWQVIDGGRAESHPQPENGHVPDESG